MEAGLNRNKVAQVPDVCGQPPSLLTISVYKMKLDMRKLSWLVRLLFSVVIVGVLTGVWLTTNAQTAKTVSLKLNDAERSLVAGSRKAVVRTGMSEQYFDRHFTLVKVVNQPGDRRVVWKFSVNEYATNVTDVLGYYTANGKRVDTHSVATTLRETSDITRTISRSKANQIMQQCIGNFRNPTVEYRAADGGVAQLFLNAESVPKQARRSEKEREREEREARDRQTQPKRTAGSDPIEEEGDEGPPITVGSVDLQTGKCTKGQLVVAP